MHKKLKKFFNYKNSKNIIIIALVFLIGILVGGKILVDKNSTPHQQLYLVHRAIDGDTIELDNGEKVRLLGINAPEEGKCYFEQSRQAMADLVAGKMVHLEKDISGSDRYGRLLRYVLLPSESPDQNDLFVNDYLVRQGYSLANPTPPDVRYRTLIYGAEQVARDAKLGLWAECNYQTYLERIRELDTAPPSADCLIKGNVSRKGYGKVYELPGCPNYDNIKIDPRKGDKYFCSEAEAQAAGFHKSQNCI